MLRRTAPVLALALTCAAALGMLGLLAFFSDRVHAVDADALTGFLRLDTPRTDATFETIAHLADPLPYALASVVLVGVALARGRRRLAAALPVVLLGSALSTQAIKELAASDRIDAYLQANYVHISNASWPSGHATAALTLGLCATLVAPAGWRPAVAAVGALFAAAMSFSILALSWHFPSDILGGYLMASLWILLAIAALAAAEHRRAETLRPQAAVPTLVVGAVAGILGVAAVLAHPRVLEQRTTFVVLAALVAAVPLVLSASVAALRGPRVPV